MDFKIRLTPEAERELDEITQYIASDSGEGRATRWHSRVVAEVGTLASMPARFPFIAEAEEIGRPLRALVVMSHRIIYEVREDEREVRVLSVYHTSRDRFVLDDEPAPPLPPEA